MQITNEIRSHFEEFEGIIPHMYQDKEGFITIGCGHLIDVKGKQLAEPPEEVYGLKFVVMLDANLKPAQRRIAWDEIMTYYKNWGGYFRPYRLATREEIRADWKTVKTAPPKNKHRFYSDYTRLGIFSDTIVQLFQIDIDRISAGVSKLYPGFNFFPVKLNWLYWISLHDWRRGLAKFVTMNSFIKQPTGPSWEKAATESNRPQVQFPRNKKIQSLFLQSATPFSDSTSSSTPLQLP